MGRLTLEQASIIVDAALRKGAEMGFKPLAVVVLDDGGNMKAMKRQDGAGPFRPQIALGKAWGAVGMGAPSRFIEKLAQERPYFANSLAAASGGRLVPVAGGVLIRDTDAVIVGSVGVSGDTSDNDETCAIAGIKAANLTPEPGEG
jgi:uncharacterized protein GlcG (DUF336 family)